VEQVMTGKQAEMCLDVACPSSAAQSWYRVRATRVGSPAPDGGFRVMIVHEEITLDKRVEEVLREREEWDRAVRTAQAERNQAEVQLQELSGRLINAQEEERRRIARELHDDLNQRLALLSIELEQYGQRPPRSAEEHRRRMREAWGRAHEISADVHRMSHQLHPSKLDTLGLVAAVKSLCHDLSQRKVLKVEFSHRQIPGLIPKDVALCLFRVVQEALSNVGKHSGAQAAKVELIGDSQELNLSVSDPGAGFNVEKVRRGGGLGLVSMQERLRLVGGDFSIDSAGGQGTRIYARVPLAAPGLAAPGLAAPGLAAPGLAAPGSSTST
jgi:signal transduction histidine kinase